MSNDANHGDQFDAGRFADGRADERAVVRHLTEIFDAHHVVAAEPDETYDNFASNKELHQLIDYTGIDYLVDPFDAPVFGVNHRTHSPSENTLRLDLRSDTGTSAPAELEKLRHAERWDIVPKYASRLKQSETGIEWFRVVSLAPLAGAINAGLQPARTWSDGDVTAWLFNYDLLETMGVVVAERRPEGDQL